DVKLRSRGAQRPSFCLRTGPRNSRGRREGRVSACTRGPRAKRLRKGAKSTGTDGTQPAFPAQWFTAYSALSSVNQTLLSPSSARCECIVANLAPATGRQDHTASPSASLSFVPRQCCVHRIPHSKSVTTRTPLIEAGRMQVFLISENKKEKYFCTALLNLSGTLIPLRNFQFPRMRFRAQRSALRADGQKNELMFDLPDKQNLVLFGALLATRLTLGP